MCTAFGENTRVSLSTHYYYYCWLYFRYHLIEQFAGWPELDGKIDNDKNKATFFAQIGLKLKESQSMAIGGNIVNDVLTLNVGDTLTVKVQHFAVNRHFIMNLCRNGRRL